MAKEEIIKEAWKEEVNAEDFVVTNGDYKNIVLNGYKGGPELSPGQYFTVQKHPDYAEMSKGQEGTSKWGGKWEKHWTRVIVAGDEVLFNLFGNPEKTNGMTEIEAFNSTGGVGDPIQISKEKFTYKTKKGEQVSERLVFRPVTQ